MKLKSEEEAPEKQVEAPPEGGVVRDESEESPALLGLCGDVNEESLQELSAGLIAANQNRILNVDESDFDGVDDLEFFISSNGGAVAEMFAVYDLMRIVKKNRDIRTYGFGKVA